MAKIIPIDNEDRELWKQLNAEALREVQDQALQEMSIPVIGGRHIGVLIFLNQHLETIFNCTRAGLFQNLDYSRKPYLKILTNSRERVCIVC
jgi:hypothetical protein